MSYEILKEAKKIHFIGIGGISMSSIAFVLLSRHYIVTGSDLYRSNMTERLSNAGAEIFYGHSPDNITDGTDVVIYTADVNEDNCELCRARELGIPCFVRAEALGYIMKDYDIPIGVSGTHGKSTTTSMLSEIFTTAKADPTVLSGAELSSNNGAYRLGDRKYFIFESCEYKDSFLSFYPKIAIILNVEEDHLDYFRDLDHIVSSFKKFAELCGENGTVIVNADCAASLRAIKAYSGNIVTFGIESKADFTAKNITYVHGRPNFDVFHNNEFYVHVCLSVYGRHTVSDALAAIAASHVCGIDKNDTVSALNGFKGAKRRFELVKKYNGADIVSDYAHHPTEIETTLNAAMSIGYDKVTCIFQPHTYKRTFEFKDGFIKALSIADKTILLPIYAKRDSDEFGIDSSMISDEIKDAKLLPDLKSAAEYVRSNAQENELYILMGAGDINKAADMI